MNVLTGHTCHGATGWPKLSFTTLPCHQHQPSPRQYRHRSLSTMASLSPPIMVNSCTGKVSMASLSFSSWSVHGISANANRDSKYIDMQMGHATAEAVVRAGLQLVPISFTGASEAVAVGNVGVSGIPVELVHPGERQSAMESVKAQYPGLVLIDFTLPSVVNGEHSKPQTTACSSCGDVIYKASCCTSIEDSIVYSMQPS